MDKTFREYIEQAYNFPQGNFELKNETLVFNGIELSKMIRKYGSPLNIIVLPKIGQQIEKAKRLFNAAIQKNNYQASYKFCYCTKCNHLYPIVNEVLKNNSNIETSSEFDIDLILNLLDKKKISLTTEIIHNGFKTKNYLKKIALLQKKGFVNSIIILDNEEEIRQVKKIFTTQKVKIGLRMAIHQPKGTFYKTSRLGVPPDDILNFFETEIKNCPKVELKMFHFFIDSGINDSPYYWAEFEKAIELYCSLKASCKDLEAINIGGGFPVQNDLNFSYNYELIASKIVEKVASICDQKNINHPDIYTEFGKFTVGESSAIIFEVLAQKKQNPEEIWYIINNSLMNTIPDSWTIDEKFIVLPINKWGDNYQAVNLGGISCDQYDYYNKDAENKAIKLPVLSPNNSAPIYVGFFHTGAYQDTISGYGGVKHCLIASPKQIIIDLDKNGNLIDYIYRQEQTIGQVYTILGY